MKFMSLILALLVALPGFAGGPIVAGTETDNGGDPCENEMESIILDIELWISKDKHLNLEVPQGITHQIYKVEMEHAIEKVKATGVSCTTEKLFIGESEKTCINSGSRIRCNLDRVSKLSEEKLYSLYHHELAGVAGLETNDGESSDYVLSRQVSGFLEDKIVKRLAIGDPMTQGDLAKQYRMRALAVKVQEREEYWQKEKDRAKWWAEQMGFTVTAVELGETNSVSTPIYVATEEGMICEFKVVRYSGDLHKSACR